MNRPRILAGLVALIAGAAFGTPTNVNPALPYAWGENIGWSDFQGDTTNGVVAGQTFLSGFAWCENVGWLNFGDGTPGGGTAYTQAAGDTGVNRNSGTGALTGDAWGENIGWVVFDPLGSPNLSAGGVFTGFAWGENVGWINLASGFGVSITAFSGVDDWSMF